VAPALWLATATVEHPIKKWFRRRRRFIHLIEAIIVGRKPGSYSFPSGHSAAAFAGALLLAREYPAGARGFFGLASLVAFSRVV
jgi:undecaprenyl-diphosphatase